LSFKYFVTSCEGISSPHKDIGRFSLDWDTKFKSALEPIKQGQKKVCSVLSTLYPGSSILIHNARIQGNNDVRLFSIHPGRGVLHLDEMCRQFADCVQTDAYHYYDFDYLIRLYSDALVKRNLIILPYELLRDDQSAFLTILEEKLGLEHIEPNFPRLNPSLSHEELYW